MVRSRLEYLGDRLARLADGGCELPSARLDILEEFGEARVNLGAAERIGDLEDSGGEQRMCEPDSVAVRLDDAGLARRQWPARLHGGLGALEHPNDLERIEGVSSRGIVHLRQQRTRKRDAQVLLDDLVQGGGLEAADSYVAAAGHAPELADEQALDAAAVCE